MFYSTNKRFTIIIEVVLFISFVVNAGTSVVSGQVPLREIVGPMVGPVTSTEATIWVWAGKDTSFVIRYWPVVNKDLVDTQLFYSDPIRHDTARITLSNLTPLTKYRYQVVNTTEIGPIVSGIFKTAPIEDEPARFTLVATSCMSRFDEDQSSWNLVGDIKPDFHILMGDNVYTNVTDRNIIFKEHLKYRSKVPEFLDIIRNTPTYAIWDDHDYADNNSDGTAPGKENSLEAFRDVWVSPEIPDAPVPGVFTKFKWADVEYFLLDVRYHRSPDSDPDDENKRMLGDEQYNWLVQQLQASTATFKVIVSGSTLRSSKDDGWFIYSFSRDRLISYIMQNNITGTIFLTGDLHKSKVLLYPTEYTGGYPLYEIISSGITKGVDRSFAVLNFDTTLPDPRINIKIINGDSSIPVDVNIYLSELQM